MIAEMNGMYTVAMAIFHSQNKLPEVPKSLESGGCPQNSWEKYHQGAVENHISD